MSEVKQKAKGLATQLRLSENLMTNLQSFIYLRGEGLVHCINESREGLVHCINDSREGLVYNTNHSSEGLVFNINQSKEGLFSNTNQPRECFNCTIKTSQGKL